jgi:hypothetical protein
MPTVLSTEYIHLCKRLNELRINLLPQSFDPTGNYQPADYDKTRGFVALAHAEVEDYLETRCLAVAVLAHANWLSSRTSSPVVFSLYAACYSGWSAIAGCDFGLKSPTNQISIEARLSDALQQYKKIIDSNNGIKRDTFKHFLVPLSLRVPGDIDDAWLTEMDNFGKSRGLIVHKTGRINTPPDPKDSYNKVWKTVIPGIRKLDKLLAGNCL